MENVFESQNTSLKDIDWSSNSQFFILTSTTGDIGAIKRSGKSLKHCICDLSHSDII